MKTSAVNRLKYFVTTMKYTVLNRDFKEYVWLWIKETQISCPLLVLARLASLLTWALNALCPKIYFGLLVNETNFCVGQQGSRT